MKYIILPLLVTLGWVAMIFLMSKFNEWGLGVEYYGALAIFMALLYSIPMALSIRKYYGQQSGRIPKKSSS